MRSSFSRCLLALLVSCGGQAAPHVAGPATNASSAPAARSEPVRNSTPLRADALDSPRSEGSVSFAAPELGEQVMIADPRSYRVRVITELRGPDIVGVELALDAGRPRRLSLADPTLTLGELLSEGKELGKGAHWLFAVPISAAGLVPCAAAGAPRAAQARRFFVGKTPEETAGAAGAVWLRRPDGTYNGAKSGESVLFDAFAFSALGAALDTPIAITLESVQVSGKLELASPFLLREVPSGVYQVTVSAVTAPPSTTHFTVNRELSGGS